MKWRKFIFVLTATVLGCGKESAVLAPDASTADHPHNAQEAIEALLAGNRRFAEGHSLHPHESAAYRATLASEQHPFAVVLSCSDSRVAPVLVFDQGVGDLFVVSVAGNIVDPDVAGSIEYAVDHLHTHLVVVLGHQNCGAVTAALHAREQKLDEPEEIDTLLSHITPALQQIDLSLPAGEQVEQAVAANVRQSIELLEHIPDLAKSIKSGEVRIVGAVYSLERGTVELLDRATVR